MRILLVNPWIYDFAAYDLWSKPLGLIAVASYLQQMDCQVILVDCLDRFHPLMKDFSTKKSIYADGHYYYQLVEKPECFYDIPRRYKRYGMPIEVFKSILDSISEVDLILVGSSLTYWYKGVFLAITLLKQRYNNTPVILGGIYATLCYNHAKKHSRADFVFKGNNLTNLVKLINSIARNKISVKKMYSAKDLYISAYNLYPHLEYVTLRTSNGCPFHCSYCGWYKLQSDFIQYDYRDVYNSIELFSKKHAIKNIAFYDDALLYNSQKHFLKIFNLVVKNKLKCNFHTPNGLHCRYINRDVAFLMRQANFVRPRLGLETVDVEMQKSSGGKVTMMDFERAVKALNGAGYPLDEIGVNLLVGLPQQKFKDVYNSIIFLKKYGCRINLEEFSPVPGTPDFLKLPKKFREEPLNHNNTSFVLRHPEFKDKIQTLKDIIHQR